MSSWLWGTSVADEAIDKATSELLPAGAEDIALNLEICDQIRAKSIPAKDAVRALKRRLNHKNPNVQLLALGLTDVCIKNGGDHFLIEVAARDFMDNLVSILKQPGLNMDVKNKILRLVQNWALAFEGKAQLVYVPTVYKELQSEGFTFPPKDYATTSAMVDTKTAPEWIDSDVCLRCRTAFTFTNRKHHCRNCGQVFDQQCSSKNLPLPHFGITQEVRVCDGCFAKLTRQRVKSNAPAPPPRISSRPHRSTRSVEDADLERAIQLSLQEASGSGSSASHRRPGYVPYQPAPEKWQGPSEPPIVDHKTRPSNVPEDEEDDPDLRAAIEASLREANVPRPSAPIETSRTEAPTFPAYGQPSYQASTPTPSAPGLPTLPNYDLDPLETDVILTYNQTIAQIDAQNRPDIVRYPAVTELHNRAGSLQPRFDRSLDDTERKERLLEEMNAKLSQAVRLYDSILTQQVARPAWRQQQQQQQQQQPLAPSATYQQHTLTAYTPQQQWAAPSSPVPNVHPYATQPYAQSSSPVQTYMPFSPSSMTYQASAAPVSFTSGPQLPAVSAPTAPLSPAPIAAAPPPPPLRQDSYARAQVASPAPPVQQYAPQPQHAQPFQTLPPSQQTMPAFPNVPSYAPFPNVPAGTAYAPSPGVEKVEAKEVALIEL